MECNVFGSLLALKTLRDSLGVWLRVFNSCSEPKQSQTFFTFTKKLKLNAKINLLNFLCQLYQSFLSKFSLYFYGMLTKYIPYSDIPSVSYPNILQNFNNFSRKSGAQLICLVANKIERLGPSNNFTSVRLNTEFESCIDNGTTTKAKYNALFISSQEKHVLDLYHSSIINFLDVTNLNNGKICYLYDKAKDNTFFAANIEGVISLVLFYNRKVQERESNILSFINDSLLYLRCSKNFLELKNV